MNYGYDIILNWNEKKAYDFYEWNDFDYLEILKKIPLFKIKHKSFLDMALNNIKVNQEFLSTIKDKTLLSTKNIIAKLEYASLFTDGKNVLALEFNEKGEVLSRSNLLLDDELNILDQASSLKETSLIITVLEPLNNDNTLRQIKEAKQLILLEVTNLYKRNDKSKLKYLYFEYQKETVDDLNKIYKKILDDLNEEFNPNLLKLYYIIKLSYHNV